jgi:lysophospholipase L1-like esterase
VANLVREVALENGCAYWDMYRAMGGEGAVVRWLNKGQMNEDLIHPRARGMDALGHLFDFALARAHIASQGGAAFEDPPGLESPEALAPLFAKLQGLERKQETRVGLLQLGASHTSCHMFTDAVRMRLGKRFGEAGRGFIAAGRSSKRLEVSGTERNLVGAWEVLDAMKPGGSRAFGLTGVRAEGVAGTTAEFSFCKDCDAKVGSRLQVHFLAAPGMGQMEVRLDGEKMAAFPPPGEAVKSAGPRLIELRAPGAKHVVTVADLGPGPMSLFGVAHELDRPGIVLDAVGLPGSTVFTLASYDQAALAQELAARRPSAFFLFYGTNESSLRELDTQAMRAKYVTVFETLHKASPGAACLLIGPTDRQEQQGPKGEWLEAPSQRRVISVLREIARANGCAFWSARAAMGGPGSIRRWLEREPPLANEDRIHLTPEGYELLAGAFVDDLLAAYDAAAKKGGE